MIKFSITIIVMLISHFSYGQTWAKWFQEKKTQIQYLEKQVVALKAYAMVAQKGYAIAKSGLKAIGNIKKGDFNLHSDYFSSLATVNPNVNGYTKIAGIISMQLNIIKACHSQKNDLESSEEFTTIELAYACKVWDHLLQGCTEIIDQLIAITADGLFQMKDDERIKGIDKLYDEMEKRQRFIHEFGNENNKMAIQRLREGNDVKVGRALYVK